MRRNFVAWIKTTFLVSHLLQLAILQFVVALEFIACSSNETKQVQNTIRDSLGVEIIENHTPIWDEEDQWKLSERPILEISDEAFYRIVGAVQLEDGRIVVANSGSGELRFYDKKGNFVTSVGNSGQGPGEFTFLLSLYKFPGDSLLTFDGRGVNRVSIFKSDGELLRDFILESEGKFPLNNVSAFSDGSLFVSTSYSSALDRKDHTTGLKRYPTPFLHYSSQGVLIDTVAILPGLETFKFVEGDGYTLTSNFPFRHSPVSFVYLDKAYIGSSDKFEILAFSKTGDLIRIIRLSGIDLTLTSKKINEAKQILLDLMDDPELKKRYTKYFSKLPETQRKPAYSRLVIDVEGNLWVGEYLLGIVEPQNWWVFNQEGYWLGKIKTPGNYRVYEIGHDYVLGKKTDEDGFESIYVYELIKP